MQPQDQEQWQQPPEASPQIVATSQMERPVQAEVSQPMVDSTSNPEVVQPSSVEDEVLLRWQAHEYVQHDRTIIWYIVFGFVAIGMMLVAILLIKSVTFAVLIPVMAVALVVYVRRQPALLNYVLSKKGLYVNDKLHPYSDFKAFGIVSFAGHHTAQLIPRKRFQIGQSVYFPEEVGETLVDMLAARLPMQDVKPDLYDRIIAKLKM